MNAAETIRMAIEKLTEERQGVGAGEWYRSTGGIATVLEGGARSSLIAGEDEEEGALDLVVTLHRTIDAQLAILRNAQDTYRTSFEATQRPPRGLDDEGGVFFRLPERAADNATYHVRRELALAIAILGGDL